jgi:hypothetical protein
MDRADTRPPERLLSTTVTPDVPLSWRRALKAATKQRHMRHTPTRNGVEQAVRALHGNHRQRLTPQWRVRDEACAYAATPRVGR